MRRHLPVQFDSWDRDGGGSLDVSELRGALSKVGEKARIWRSRVDPNAKRAAALRTRAHHFKEAAEATRSFERLENDLENLVKLHSSSAEIRLGELLAKRCIKPGAVVTQWSTSRGKHAGELSKREFRVAVQTLGLANSGVSEEDIDNVFDKFDEVRNCAQEAEADGGMHHLHSRSQFTGGDSPSRRTAGAISMLRRRRQ